MWLARCHVASGNQKSKTVSNYGVDLFFFIEIYYKITLSKCISLFGGDLLFLVLAINLAKKCLILELTSFQKWWRPTGTLLGLDVAQEDEKVADL